MIKNVLFDLLGVIVNETPASFTRYGPDILSFCTQKYNTYLVSNSKPEKMERLKLIFPNLFDQFTAIVTPIQSGYKKPDVRMFEYVLKTYNLNPEECLYIDDTFENIQAAETLGIQIILYTDELRVKEHIIRSLQT